MLDQPKVSRDLLKQLLYGYETKEQLTEFMSKHPELQPYYDVATPMHKALMMILAALSYQLIIPEDELDSAEDILDPKFRKYLLYCLTPDQGLSKRPELPDELLKNIISKAENRSEALYLFLTILAGVEYPDYLTEESYWLVNELEAASIGRDFHIDDARLEQELKEMLFIWNSFLLARCKHALRVCLTNGLTKQVVLEAISKT
ncbi:MAG: hypothetical protein RML93_04330 [Anaerolineales bacterium]|nr:hypothetical protein [Anaerolineales bacterium]MCS7247876.1 hypothetical protein [Anaerolineales bacterium]MDW8161686.1 hypothetical protein [Anaerolineales bacterium]MDW8446505.1 hypothetical protein [Anaerolineales bacterium]